MIHCLDPAGHFPGIPADAPATVICCLCYTPAIPVTERPKEPYVGAMAKLIGWQRHGGNTGGRRIDPIVDEILRAIDKASA